jgi:hypothetical protein
VQQILEYSFARVLVRLVGVILTIFGLLYIVSLVDWLIYLLTEDTSQRYTSLAALLRSVMPTAAGALVYCGFGVYLARDGHILARILVAGLHGRCRRCGYDIRAVTAPTCPECGAAIVREDPPAPAPPGPTS